MGKTINMDLKQTQTVYKRLLESDWWKETVSQHIGRDIILNQRLLSIVDTNLFPSETVYDGSMEKTITITQKKIQSTLRKKRFAGRDKIEDFLDFLLTKVEKKPIATKNILNHEEIQKRENHSILQSIIHAENKEEIIMLIEHSLISRTYEKTIYIALLVQCCNFEVELEDIKLVEINSLISQSYSANDFRNITQLFFAINWRLNYMRNNPELSKSIIHHCIDEVSKYDIVAKSKLLYSMLWLEEIQIFSDTISEIFHSIEQDDISNFTDIDFIALKQIYSFYNRNIPESFDIQYHFAVLEESKEDTRGFIEKQMYKEVLEYLPSAQFNVYIDGFECDIYIPEYKLNIECDGKFHVWNTIYKNSRRDKYLKDMHNIDTLRIWPNTPSERIKYKAKVHSYIKSLCNINN